MTGVLTVLNELDTAGVACALRFAQAAEFVLRLFVYAPLVDECPPGCDCLLDRARQALRLLEPAFAPPPATTTLVLTPLRAGPPCPRCHGVRCICDDPRD